MTDKRKSPIESAMRDGTILGCLWTATFALSTVMLKTLVNSQSVILPFAILVMVLLSPYIAYKLTVKHRNSERGGFITFGEAWIHIATMYLCAILLSGIAQYVYYEFIDPNAFSGLAAQLIAHAGNSGISEASIKPFTDALYAMDSMSTGEMLLSTITGHLSRDVIIALVLALIVKKNP